MDEIIKYHRSVETMPNDASLIQRDVSSKLRRLEKHDSQVRKKIDKFRIGSVVKHEKDKNKSKQDVDSKLAVSMRKLSLGTTKSPKKQFAKSVGRNMKSQFMSNLVMWVEKVFAEVGPGKKENIYQNKLKDLFLSLGYHVGYEVPLKYFRQDSKPISKRADLIIKAPFALERILIECKAKKEFEKTDFEQVCFYQDHFGISDCYLVNFRVDPQIFRLKS